MDDGRLPKRVTYGKIKDGVKKGRGEQEKECATCVEGDVQASRSNKTGNTKPKIARAGPK